VRGCPSEEVRRVRLRCKTFKAAIPLGVSLLFFVFPFHRYAEHSHSECAKDPARSQHLTPRILSYNKYASTTLEQNLYGSLCCSCP